MYYINIVDITTNKSWKEEFWDYEKFRKRYYKIEHSKNLFATSSSLIYD